VGVVSIDQALLQVTYQPCEQVVSFQRRHVKRLSQALSGDLHQGIPLSIATSESPRIQSVSSLGRKTILDAAYRTMPSPQNLAAPRVSAVRRAKLYRRALPLPLDTRNGTSDALET